MYSDMKNVGRQKGICFLMKVIEGIDSLTQKYNE